MTNHRSSSFEWPHVFDMRKICNFTMIYSHRTDCVYKRICECMFKKHRQTHHMQMFTDILPAFNFFVKGSVHAGDDSFIFFLHYIFHLIFNSWNALVLKWIFGSKQSFIHTRLDFLVHLHVNNTWALFVTWNIILGQNYVKYSLEEE